MPYFHGNDVVELQSALGALGFACGGADGIFGAYTEDALRTFQTNMGLPTDGIAGAYTYAAIRNLHHSWEGKEAMREGAHLGFARAAEVLEGNALCLFGTEQFTRSVASRMSNLALATSPTSKILSADSLLVAPDEDMLLVHIVLPGEATNVGGPRVAYTDDRRRLAGAALEVRAFGRARCQAGAHCGRASRHDVGGCGRGPLRPAFRHHAARRHLLRIVLTRLVKLYFPERGRPSRHRGIEKPPRGLFLFWKQSDARMKPFPSKTDPASRRTG